VKLSSDNFILSSGLSTQKFANNRRYKESCISHGKSMSRSSIRRKTDSSLTKKVRRRFRVWSWNSFPQIFHSHLFLSVTSQACQARVPEPHLVRAFARPVLPLKRPCSLLRTETVTGNVEAIGAAVGAAVGAGGVVVQLGT